MRGFFTLCFAHAYIISSIKLIILIVKNLNKNDVDKKIVCTQLYLKYLYI